MNITKVALNLSHDPQPHRYITHKYDTYQVLFPNFFLLYSIYVSISRFPLRCFLPRSLHSDIHHSADELGHIIVPLRRQGDVSLLLPGSLHVDRPGESPKVYDRLRRNPLQVHVCITASVPVHPRRRSRADAFRESFRSSFHSGKAVYRSAR